MASNFHFLYDINVHNNSPAYAIALNSPVLATLLGEKSLEVVRLYQARVGKKTGRLAASADAGVRVGGKRNDRIIGAVTIADQSVVSEWKGKPFYYGVFHEEGTDGAMSGRGSRRAKRRKTESRAPKGGYHELREVATEWRQT